VTFRLTHFGSAAVADLSATAGNVLRTVRIRINSERAADGYEGSPSGSGFDHGAEHITLVEDDPD
jgi:hypothetical protein